MVELLCYRQAANEKTQRSYKARGAYSDGTQPQVKEHPNKHGN